ncbi:hypothetical protein BaRGS_00024489 [Batillaria attramentaria]|uniref:Uncharacterized protein n=1 Tax=Batillaria attramentaria TaxID=370345 RepID=A0ABD0JIS9_9CAEN
MEEDIPMLGLSDLATGPLSHFGWCEPCKTKDEEIARLNQEHATNELNFKALKKKIIATEELTVLEAQLMNALEEMEPVKKAKKELEAALGKKDEEIERLQIKLDSAESLNNQYEMRLATIELTHRNADDAVSDSKKKMNALEQG